MALNYLNYLDYLDQLENLEIRGYRLPLEYADANRFIRWPAKQKEAREPESIRKHLTLASARGHPELSIHAHAHAHADADAGRRGEGRLVGWMFWVVLNCWQATSGNSHCGFASPSPSSLIMVIRVILSNLQQHEAGQAKQYPYSESSNHQKEYVHRQGSRIANSE